jgi:hypothetical protein
VISELAGETESRRAGEREREREREREIIHKMTTQVASDEGPHGMGDYCFTICSKL